MSDVLIVAVLIAVGATVLLLLLSVLAVPWRYLPLSQRVSELAFTLLAALLLTPVPVGLGVSAMYYPVAILYTDAAQLKWHLGWYSRAPELVAPSVILMIAIAYFVSHKLLPKKSRRAQRTSFTSKIEP